MEGLIKVTPEIQSRIRQMNPCKVPDLGRDATSFKQSELMWVEDNGLVIVLPTVGIESFGAIPLWCYSGAGYSYGYGYGYVGGAGYGDGAGYGYGYGDGAGYGYGTARALFRALAAENENAESEK